MQPTWTIAIAEKASGRSFKTRARFTFSHDEINDGFQFSPAAVRGRHSDCVLDQIDIAIRKGDKLTDQVGILHGNQHGPDSRQPLSSSARL
jgi:hypothetical protein